jgi:hypothetical protein
MTGTASVGLIGPRITVTASTSGAMKGSQESTFWAPVGEQHGTAPGGVEQQAHQRPCPNPRTAGANR